MVYLGIVFFFVGAWQAFMRGRISPIISGISLILGVVFVFIGNWQLGLFFVFLFVSWWLLMQIFRFSTYHGYFLKAIPVLIAYALLISFLLGQFGLQNLFSWYMGLTGVFLFINHERQYQFNESLLELFSNKEKRTDVELSCNRTIRYYFLSSLVFIASLSLAAFIFDGQDDPRGKTASHVMKAIDYGNQAGVIVGGKDKEYSIMPKDEADVMFKSYANALAEAEMADIALMNKHFPGFGDHFEQEFIKGLKIILDSHKSGDVKKALTGQYHIIQWTKWYDGNSDEIRKRKS